MGSTSESRALVLCSDGSCGSFDLADARARLLERCRQVLTCLAHGVIELMLMLPVSHDCWLAFFVFHLGFNSTWLSRAGASVFMFVRRCVCV